MCCTCRRKPEFRAAEPWAGKKTLSQHQRLARRHAGAPLADVDVQQDVEAAVLFSQRLSRSSIPGGVVDDRHQKGARPRSETSRLTFSRPATGPVMSTPDMPASTRASASDTLATQSRRLRWQSASWRASSTCGSCVGSQGFAGRLYARLHFLQVFVQEIQIDDQAGVSSSSFFLRSYPCWDGASVTTLFFRST